MCHTVSFQVFRMLEEHDWIHSERQFFGQPNTSYDFKTNNPREAGQRLKKLEATTTKLERNINKRAMNMLNEAEERVRAETEGLGDLLNYSFGCLHLSNPVCLPPCSTMTWWRRRGSLRTTKQKSCRPSRSWTRRRMRLSTWRGRRSALTYAFVFRSFI